jgi:hypothetical protein
MNPCKMDARFAISNLAANGTVGDGHQLTVVARHGGSEQSDSVILDIRRSPSGMSVMLTSPCAKERASQGGRRLQALRAGIAGPQRQEFAFAATLCEGA